MCVCVVCVVWCVSGGTTGAVQLKQLTLTLTLSKNIQRGRIIIAQSKANCLSCTAPVVPPLVVCVCMCVWYVCVCVVWYVCVCVCVI